MTWYDWIFAGIALLFAVFLCIAGLGSLGENSDAIRHLIEERRKFEDRKDPR